MYEHLAACWKTSTDDRWDSLKPCPFCGSEPMLGKVESGTRRHPPIFAVTCIRCGAEMQGEFIPELVRRWNDRVDAPCAVDMEKARAAAACVMERIPNALRMLEDS